MFRLLICLILFVLAGCSSRQSANADSDIIDQKFEISQDGAYRGENGKVIVRLKNGVVITKNYSNGKQEGETTYTFPHCDAVEFSEFYSKGKLERKVANYYCGHCKEEVRYLPFGQQVTSYYDNGSVKSTEDYRDDRLNFGEYYNPSLAVESQIKNGTGQRVNRDENGELISIEHFESGKIAQKIVNYPNGSPKEVTPYRNGVLDGVRKTYLPAGEPSTIEQWIGGVQEGMTIIFQNGEKYAEVPYDKGMKNGVEKRYRNGKTVVEEINWQDNMRHGPSYTYIGDTVKTDYYFHGKEVSKSQYELLMNEGA